MKGAGLTTTTGVVIGMETSLGVVIGILAFPLNARDLPCWIHNQAVSKLHSAFKEPVVFPDQLCG